MSPEIALLLAASALSLAAWSYLLLGHGRFWRADQRLDDRASGPEAWPGVVAVVPARDEADVIDRAVASLLDQDYPGNFHVVLADDGSSDGTAEVARAAAARHPRGDRLAVVTVDPPPPGWAGKTWAMRFGTAQAAARFPEATYLLLTDADIGHSPGNLRRLVGKAEAERLDLVSLMVKLHCRGLWEGLLIPAFVFFFQKLYPFPRVNDRASGLAGAAGGCMLVRSAALARAGGIDAIAGAIIDDCALAERIKRQGPIWLGLTESETSLRPYAGLAGIWRMVARSAFTQLHYSAAILAGTVFGMVMLYLAPPLALLTYPWHHSIAGATLAATAWLAMAVAYAPTLRLYRRSRARGLLLPAAALLYVLMTIDSAIRYWRGRGGQWKGRDQANMVGSA